ncbi:GIN domain-containing protein [Chloroflexota bacterium]
MAKKIITSLTTVTLIIGLLVIASGYGCTHTENSSSSWPVITGSGDLEPKEMDYIDFTKIEVGYAFQADITRSDSFFVSITLDNNLFEYLDIGKTGDTLYIRLKPRFNYRRSTQRAIITMPSLHAVKLSGASTGDVQGFSSAGSLQLGVSGASNLNIEDITATDTEFEISGASRVLGDIEMADGDFYVSGASTVELEGTAEDVSLIVSGASSVRLTELSTVNTSIELSGASTGKVDVSARLDCIVSGASRLECLGDPELGIVNVSGGSTMIKK